MDKILTNGRPPVPGAPTASVVLAPLPYLVEADEIALFRLAHEALTNVRRHAGLAAAELRSAGRMRASCWEWRIADAGLT